MLAEFLMAVFGWNEIWCVSIGNPENPPPGRSRHDPLQFLKTPGFRVGVWTGPDGDMFCVRRCSSATVAESYRSPPGRTVLLAVAKAVVVRLCTDLVRSLQESDSRRRDTTYQSGSRAR